MNSSLSFDTLAADAHWQVFTEREREIQADFMPRWAIRPGQQVLPCLSASRAAAAQHAPARWGAHVRGMLWIAHTCSRDFVNQVHREAAPSFHNHLLPAPGELGRLLRQSGLQAVVVEDDSDRFLARDVRP